MQNDVVWNFYRQKIESKSGERTLLTVWKVTLRKNALSRVVSFYILSPTCVEFHLILFSVQSQLFGEAFTTSQRPYFSSYTLSNQTESALRFRKSITTDTCAALVFFEAWNCLYLLADNLCKKFVLWILGFYKHEQQHVRFLPENPELDGYVPDQEKPHKQTESQKSSRAFLFITGRFPWDRNVYF